jgi:hypothetical protein
MTLPESLAGRLYLLGCRAEGDRPPGGMEAAPRLRAAALADLWLAGVVDSEAAEDPKGLVALIGGSAHPDPVGAALLAEIGAQRKPRSWTWWVGHGERATARAVEGQLAASGAIAVTRSRWLGILPRTRVHVADPAGVEAQRAAIRAILLGRTPVAELDRRELLLVALAVTGELKPLRDRAERRAARGRVQEILAAVGPIPAALRKVIATKKAEVAGGAAAVAATGATSC